MTKIKRPKNFNPIKPVENNQAAVVSGWKFHSPGGGYGGYLDYTSRQKAVDRDGYHDLLDYTARKTAVRLDGQKPGSDYSPTFTQKADYSSPTQMADLKKNLWLAEKNKSPLQYNFVSLSTKFLQENNLYQSDGTTDQTKIKQAMRLAMAKLMTNEKFGPTAFWWGNIQFDTNHIHVHIGLSELHSTRRKISKGPHQGEYAGKMNVKSMEKFKSTFTRELIRLGNAPERNRILDLQIQIDAQRQNLIKKLQPDEQLLQQLFLELPRDKRKWFASHDKTTEMKSAIKDARVYVQNFLIHDPDFQIFKAAVVQESKLNRQLYGQTSKDTAPAKTKKLEDRLINEVFSTIRHEDQFQLSVKSLTRDVSPETVEDNRLKINGLRQQLNQGGLTDTQHRLLKRELITRKVGYKLQNRELKIASVQAESDRLQGLLASAGNTELNLGDRAFLAQKQLFLADFEHCLRTNDPRSKAYENPLNLQVGQMKQATFDQVLKRLETELKSVNQVGSPRLLKEVYQNAGTKHQFKKSLRAQIRIVKIKRQLFLENGSERDKRPLYRQLNKQTNIAAPTLHNYTAQPKTLEKQEVSLKRLPTRTVRHKLRQQLSGQVKAAINDLRRSNANLARTAQEESQALNQRLNADRQEEMEQEQAQYHDRQR